MFDVVLSVFMVLVSVAAFFNYKKFKLDDHLKYAFILGLVALLFAALTQVEFYVRGVFPFGTTLALPTLLFSFLIPAGWEPVLYAIFALFSALALYLVGAFIGAVDEAISKYF